MAHIVELIFAEEKRGKGTETDPIRLVAQLWTTDGKLICETDRETGVWQLFHNDLADLKHVRRQTPRMNHLQM